MATIEDKLTAEVVPLKSFTYDQAKSALLANPSQKNISNLARQWGVTWSTARRWVAKCKAETEAALDCRQSFNAAEKKRLAVALHVLEPFRTIRRTIPMQYLYSFLLVALDEGLGVMEYAKKAGVAQSVMSRNLLDLGDRARGGGPGYGFVTMRQDPLNLRRHQVVLTDKGLAVAGQIMHATGQ
jgi:hypothetical protein